MPVTLTDEQVAELRGKLAQADRDALVRQSAEAIWNDPELSDSAKALWKKKFPETTIADYDLKREVFGRLDAEKKERDDAAREKAEAEQVERYRSQKARVQKERGFTARGILADKSLIAIRIIEFHPSCDGEALGSIDNGGGDIRVAAGDPG